MSAAGGLRRATLVAYGAPGLAAAIPVIPVAVLLPTWYARDLGLGFALTGLVLALARVLDFLADPLIGLLTDRRGWGGLRYKPWVLAGALLAGFGMALLARPPATVGAVHLAVGAVCLFVGWSLFTIPYTAWGAELSDDVHERSLVAAARELAGLVGMLVALALPALLVLNLGDAAPAPFAVLAVAAGVLGVPAIAALLLRVPEPEPGTRATHGEVAWRDFVALLRVPDCRRTLVCWFVNGIANGLPAVLFPLVVSDWLSLAERDTFLLLACYFGAAVGGAPLWLALARRYGKTPAWRIAIAVNVVVFAQVAWLGPHNAAWFYLVCLLSGLTLGADLALPPSIQADVLAADRAASGRRRTASAFALWTMATKLALALAVAVAFIGLGADAAPAAGAATAIDPARLLVGYVGLPVLLKLSLLVLLRTPLETPSGPHREAPPERAQHAAEQG
ncbi:MAG: MFS transporter [Gammaproteobacteria bacterium]